MTRQNTPRNRPLERLRRILTASENTIQPSSELAQQLEISVPQLHEYVRVMVIKGLLAQEPMTENQYRITSRGQSFLAWYQRIQRELLPQRSTS